MCSNRALPAQVPVLQVVDELEALSWWSEYYEARSNAVRARVRFRVRFFAAARRAQVTGTFTRKRLLAAQLRVAAAVREMTAPMARGAYLAAINRAQLALADMYLRGYGVTADPATAARWSWT